MPNKESQIRSKRIKKKIKLIKETQKEVIDKPVVSKTNILIPKQLSSNSTKLRSNYYQDQHIVPKNPFSLLNIGPGGSGKSTCVNYMLLNMYKDFFDEVYLLSPTGHTDDIVKHLKIKKKNIFTKNIEQHATAIIEKRKKLCEKRKGPQHCGTCLVYFDDCSGLHDLNKSQALIDAFVLLRHYGCSVISNIHKLRGTVHKMIRMNAKSVIAFPANNEEKEAIVQEFSPPNMTKKEFGELINYAWTPDDKIKYPFLFINLACPFKTRYRKGFHQILKLNK